MGYFIILPFPLFLWYIIYQTFKNKNIMSLKKIGQGCFTTCYLETKKTVLLHSFDPIKEAYSQAIPNKYFPNVERVWEKEYSSKNGSLLIWFRMEYFPRVKSLKNTLKPSQYKLYKELRTIADKVGELNIGSHGERVRGWKKTCNLQDTIKSSNLHHSQKEIILSRINDCQNYTDCVIMEVSPRNVAVKNGELILLDIFFCGNALERLRKSQEEKRKQLASYW